MNRAQRRRLKSKKKAGSNRVNPRTKAGFERYSEYKSKRVYKI
tara:strand:- start:472 stop:600 length:129 start_codon:yes stop_codon:yes gene_type:complete